MSSGVVRFSRRHTFEFVPAGFFGRLLSRLMQFCTPCMLWRNGALMTGNVDQVWRPQRHFAW